MSKIVPVTAGAKDQGDIEAGLEPKAEVVIDVAPEGTSASSPKAKPNKNAPAPPARKASVRRTRTKAKMAANGETKTTSSQNPNEATATGSRSEPNAAGAADSNADVDGKKAQPVKKQPAPPPPRDQKEAKSPDAKSTKVKVQTESFEPNAGDAADANADADANANADADSKTEQQVKKQPAPPPPRDQKEQKSPDDKPTKTKTKVKTKAKGKGAGQVEEKTHGNEKSGKLAPVRGPTIRAKKSSSVVRESLEEKIPENKETSIAGPTARAAPKSVGATKTDEPEQKSGDENKLPSNQTASDTEKVGDSKPLARGPTTRGSKRSKTGRTATVHPEIVNSKQGPSTSPETDGEPTSSPDTTTTNSSGSLPSVLKATEVHTGTVFQNERHGVGGEGLNEFEKQPDDEAYIPISFARTKIEELTEKLMKMREEHHAILAQMSTKYEERQNVAKAHYTDFVKRIQAAAVAKVNATQALLDTADERWATERDKLTAEYEDKVSELQERLTTDSRELIDQQQGDYKQRIASSEELLQTTQAQRDEAEAKLGEVTDSLAKLKIQFDKASVEIASSRELFEKRVISLQVQSDKDRERLKAMHTALANQRANTAALLAQAAVSIKALEQAGEGGAVVQIQAAPVPAGAGRGGADPAQLATVRAQLVEAQTKVADFEDQVKSLQAEANTLKERLKLHEEAEAKAAQGAADGDVPPSLEAKQLDMLHKEMALLEGKLEESRTELKDVSHKLHVSETAATAKAHELEGQIKKLKAERDAAVASEGTTSAVAVSSSSDSEAVQKLEQEIAARDAELKTSKAKLAQLTEASKATMDSETEAATLRNELKASQTEVASLQARIKAREESAEGAAMVPASELDVLSKSLEESRAELATARASLVADKAQSDKDILALNQKIAELIAAGASASSSGTDDAQVKRLKKQAKMLEAASSKQKAHIAELEGRLASLSTVSADSAKLAEDLSEKEHELAGFRNKITELEAQIDAAMKAQETGEKIDSAELAARVAALKGDLQVQSEAVAATSGAAAAALEAKNAELEAQLAKLKADYAALELKKAEGNSTKKAAPPPPSRKSAPDPNVLAKAVSEYTDRIDALEQEKTQLEERVAALETANAAAAAAAGGDNSASLKLAEENAHNLAEISKLQAEVEDLTSERDALIAKVSQLQAGAAAGEAESAEAQVTRPVAASLAGARADAASNVAGKKYAAAKSTLSAALKAALDELSNGGAKNAHASLKKAYGASLKKKGAAAVCSAMDKAIVNFVVEFGDAALLNVTPAASAGSSGGGGSGRGGSDMKAKLDEATAELKKLKAELKAAQSEAASATKIAEKKFAEEKKQLTKDQKATAVQIRKLEAALEKAEKNGAGAQAAKAAADEAAKLEKRMAALEKKHKAEVDAINAANEAAVGKLELKAKKAEATLTHCQEDLAEMTAEMNKQKKIASSMGSLKEEMEGLRAKAEELEQNKKTMKAQTKKMEELEALYKKESVLRKRYWNMMEDMKGKIRVYCRCRPFAQYEIDKKCKAVVAFPDDVTIKVAQNRDDKEFIYDQCFSGTSSQEEVFEDCRRLVQSAMDGFNVCVFAYGQTGSGKTWTMVGKPEMEGCGGLTPRSIDELFSLAAENKQAETTVSCYMIEIYNDNLVDLLYVMQQREAGKKVKPGTEPRLDIKKDSKGMVVIQGAVVLECPTAARTMQIFNAGNAVRHVGSTKMNAESSRSHLIFAVLIKVYDKQTKKTANGKFSFIDLAGSERAGKTGATAERLKEAMSINKSLSALGNVISALSTNEKFIPYRDNKLTLVMSDSLGGNAKTLMFVNVSPADYNAEETLTSLVYASRVKLITNDAKQEQDSAEITRLKKIIANLKKGLPAQEEGDIGEDAGGGAKEEGEAGDDE